MTRFSAFLAALLVLVAPLSAAGQVVETEPDPARTDRSVTVYFNADEGTGGLANHSGDVYAHTGISTNQNPEGAWKCVKNHWPTSGDFAGNRSDTKLTKVATNRYKLEISDIRAFYQNTSTSCTLASDEAVETMNFVFRNADGSKEGKAEGGTDIYADVVDVAGGESFVGASITAPQANPPLYPFIVSTDTTVTVSIEADTANVESISALRLLVDGSEVASNQKDSLGYDLGMNTPNRYQVQAVAEADTGAGTIEDTTETVLIRTPDVTTQSRPSGTKDGINYNSDGTVTLSLNAPNKDYAYVLGDFNSWEVDPNYFMKKDGDHWWITLSGLSSSTEYGFQYFVDGKHRIADPFSHKVLTPNDKYISDQTYPNLKAYPGSETEGFVSVLETGQSDFNFDNPDFDSPPQDQMVVYELLLRDFLEQSDYQTLTDTLDYLDRLGVNAIELMPVAEFAGNNSWGYNPTFHFALDKAYGPREEFKKFVQAAHNRGMAVIMDVVYNHIDSQSPLRTLYSSAAESPFLESNDDPPCSIFFEELNQSNPFIQNYIDRANRYWVEEFNVDGFRYDLAHCIADGGGNTVNGWKDVADYVWDNVDDGTAPFTYMILEFFGTKGEKEELANYRDSDAGGMASWVGSGLNEAYSQSAMGYFNSNANIEPAFFGFADFNDPTYMPYMESHDEQWLMQKNAQFGNSGSNGYDVKALQTALDRQKLVGAFFFTLPGPRMTWQFAELGYGYEPDECLEDDGGGGICGPAAPGRTAPKPIRWQYRDPQQSPGRVDLYKTWQALLRLRNDNSELFAKDPGIGNSEQGILMSAGTGEQVRCLRLRDENLDATIVGNFGVTSFDVTLGVANGTACSFSETGTWHNFFEDTSRQVNGAQTLRLRPGEFRVYTSAAQPAPPMGLVPGAPTHRASQSVSGDGLKDFGATGIDINFSGVNNSSGTVTVEKLDEPPLNTGDVGEGNVSAYRFVIEAEGGLSVDSQTEVRFDVSTLEGATTPGDVVVYSRSTENTGSFSPLTTTYDSGANEIVAETGSFSEFVLASDTDALPVELAGFAATRTADRTVRLSWQTASETNNAGFQVQRRRSDASAWTDVAFVEGAGTTDEAQSYRFTDEVGFAADSVRYRLKQVDADGSTRVSDAVTVALGAPEQLTLRAPFPNPVRGQATIRYAVPSRQKVSLMLFDVLGRRVRTLTQSPQEGRHERQLDVSGLSSGTYLLRLRGAERVETRRLTVVQ